MFCARGSHTSSNAKARLSLNVRALFIAVGATIHCKHTENAHIRWYNSQKCFSCVRRCALGVYVAVANQMHNGGPKSHSHAHEQIFKHTMLGCGVCSTKTSLVRLWALIDLLQSDLGVLSVTLVTVYNECGRSVPYCAYFSFSVTFERRQFKLIISTTRCEEKQSNVHCEWSQFDFILLYMSCSCMAIWEIKFNKVRVRPRSASFDWHWNIRREIYTSTLNAYLPHSNKIIKIIEY